MLSNNRVKILIGSPVNQKPIILKHFLNSLLNLSRGNLDIHYFFIDDNEQNESSVLLEEFSKSEQNVILKKSEHEDKYERNEQTHVWSEQLIWKVAEFKDSIIQAAKIGEYDYLFLVDSDLVLHPNTINQLLKAKKDIISNVFWTKWQPNYPELPQVWMFDHYEQYKKRRNENLTKEQLLTRHKEFIEMLRKPGVYEVGGLGACTLISQNAISKGISFKEIKNISFWGEDRHFCIRAQALGIDLFVETTYPAHHIYRDSDIMEIPNYNGEIDSVTYNNIKLSVINGLQAIGSFHYEYGYNKNWKLYFSNEMANYLFQIMESEYEKNVQNKLLIKATVIKCDIFIENNHIKASFTFVNDGVENGLHFSEEVSGFVILIQDNKKDWIINQIILEDQNID
ncbi:hypothetical protein [Metabacillus niabensis]|uniref:hypothetical protein n=1 Tax=Metabacillus niabensis TaxID=324854 RepID=UPI00399EF894